MTCVMPAAVGFWAQLAQASLIGAVSGAVGAAANGTSILKGAFYGAFSAAAGFVGGPLGGAIAVGAIADREGGSFGRAILAAAIGGAGGAGSQPSFTGLLQSAVLGGVATRITGGKFKNGAASAAFMYAVQAGVSSANRSESQVDGMFGSKGTEEERQKAFDYAKSQYGNPGGVEFSDIYAVKKGKGFMYTKSRAEFDQLLIDGWKPIGGYTTGINFSESFRQGKWVDQVTVFRAAVISVNVDFAINGGKRMHGVLDSTSNALLIMGPELAHQRGIEIGPSSQYIEHTKSNTVGYNKCIESGFCKGLKWKANFE